MVSYSSAGSLHQTDGNTLKLRLLTLHGGIFVHNEFPCDRVHNLGVLRQILPGLVNLAEPARLRTCIYGIITKRKPSAILILIETID